MRRFLLVFGLIVATTARGGEIEAVGRIENLATGGNCSAVLVESDLILTAAHCLRSTAGGRVFRLGDGQPNGAVYPITRWFHHPLFEATQSRREWALRFDLAIARLATPVPTARAIPITPGPTAQIGERLFIVSWRSDGSDRPRQRACPVSPGISGLVTLGCHVQGGESGSPVLRKTAEGLELVATISSRSRMLKQPIAHASDIELRLPPLLDLINQPADPDTGSNKE